MNAITAFVDSLDTKNHKRLFIKNNQLVCVNKKEIGFWNWLRANLGFGPASLKKIAEYIEKNKAELFKTAVNETTYAKWERFKRVLQQYNKWRICWKRVKNISWNILKQATTPVSFIASEWARYKERHPIITPEKDLNLNLQHYFTSLTDKEPGGIFDPNRGYLNLLRRFENDKDGVVYPFTLRQPEIYRDQFEKLEKVLTESFKAGKKFVAMRLETSIHGLVAFFRADGKFKIIDSMMDSSIKTNQLAKQLNEASIKGTNGLPIKFKGEYINTRIQRGSDSYCTKYATLYLHQMAKVKHFKGYKQVNAAFRDNALKTYDDIAKIPEDKKLKNASSLPNDVAISFMQAWMKKVYLPKERWQDSTKEDVMSSVRRYSQVYLVTDTETKNGAFQGPHMSVEGMQSRQFILKKLGQPDVVLPQDRFVKRPFATLQDLIPKDPNERSILIKSDTNELFWIKLLPGEVIYNEITLQNGTKKLDRLSPS